MTDLPKPAQQNGRVFVLSGPTAVGKGTVVSLLKQRYPQLLVSISATTRPPRTGEVDGVHYYFISDEKFDDLVANDGLLEWALVHRTHRYGTLRETVEQGAAEGKVVLLEIDLQGARQVRSTMPDAVQIFLKPPSWQELVARLKGRGTETEEQQLNRLETAKVELAAESEFDHCVVNDDLSQTVDTLADLMGLA